MNTNVDQLRRYIHLAETSVDFERTQLERQTRHRERAASFAENPGKPGLWKLILGSTIVAGFAAFLGLVIARVIGVEHVGLGILTVAVGAVFIGWYMNDREMIADRFEALARAEHVVRIRERRVGLEVQDLEERRVQLRDAETAQQLLDGVVARGDL